MTAVDCLRVAAAVALFGCGDHGATPDAASCTVPVPAAGYGTIAAFDTTHAARVTDGAGKQTVAWLGALAPGATADVIDIQLIQGNGAFASGPPVAGTYSLTGVEAQLATCGVCVVLEVSSPRQYFAAQSGTLQIDAVDTSFNATLSNVTFAHVMIDSVTSQSTVISDGCHTSIDSASWQTPIH